MAPTAARPKVRARPGQSSRNVLHATLAAALGLLVTTVVALPAATAEGERTADQQKTQDAPKPERSRRISAERPAAPKADAAGKSADGEAPRETANAPRGKGTLQKSGAKDAQAEKAVRRAPLPEKGVYAAKTILQIATAITSLPVRIESRAIHERKVRISPRVAGRAFALAELRVLLAVHGIYLFESDDRERGRHLVATTNPAWQPRAPRFVKVLTVPSAKFRETWKALERAIETHNAKLTKTEMLAVGIPVPALGKILLRAPSRAALERLIAVRDEITRESPDPRRLRMGTYLGRFRQVEELRDSALGELTRAEREQVKFVILRRGNRMIFRAPGPLLERVEELLERFDQRAGVRR